MASDSEAGVGGVLECRGPSCPVNEVSLLGPFQPSYPESCRQPSLHWKREAAEEMERRDRETERRSSHTPHCPRQGPSPEAPSVPTREN